MTDAFGIRIETAAMRYAMAFEYDGQPFNGWQSQSHAPSVQDAVEAALSKVAAEDVRVTCSGRTDSGVHALQQVVHFDTAASRNPRSWVLGVNANLPTSIAAHWAQPVGDDFNARFDATARSYRYTVLNRWVRPARDRYRYSWVRYPLNHEWMQRGAEHLLGEHDFSSFRAAHCQAYHPVRTIESITVRRQAELVVLEITANAFLYHMVRNIVGSLISVGRGLQPPDWIAEVLLARDRKQAGKTADPQGLVYLGPRYPLRLGLPRAPLAPFPQSMWGEGK